MTYWAFLISALRDARWMTRDRAVAYRNILLIAPVMSIGVWIGLSHHGVDFLGKPLGTDFVSFWTAARVALSGRFADAYDIDLHWAAQKALFPESVLGYTAFFYPPVFLLICLPLGLVPYFWALGAWLVTTGFACWRALRLLAEGRLPFLTFFAFPAVYLNALFGQNGYLTTALYACAAANLGRRPILAGMCLGGLIFKPHLLVMVPVALIMGRAWVSLFCAAAMAFGLCLLSFAVLGLDSWLGFLAHTGLARATLDQNLVGPEKMQSVFSAVRLLGGGATAGYAAQGVSAVVVGCVLGWIAWTVKMGPALGAAMVAATLLATPFLLGYDLMLLAVPLIWMSRQAGFLPWEKTTLMAAFVLPMVSSVVAEHARLPLAPLVAAALFAVIARRLLGRGVVADASGAKSPASA